MTDTGTRWLTLGQAMKHLQISRRTLERWRTAGRIPSFRPAGGLVRFKESDLDAAMMGKEPS